MKYPDDFNTPAFPAGKFVAVSRFMATAVMVVFFCIVCLCGIILWVKKTQDASPFLVYINPNGERWTLIEHNNHRTEIPAHYVLQESLLNKFVRNWFTISDNVLLNQANWAKCSRNDPICIGESNNQNETCAIYCVSDDNVFNSFEKVVLPIYSALEADNAAVWTVKKVYIKPLDSIDSITKDGGIWQLNVIVQTDAGLINFMGYARTGYNKEQYPKTMGYYILDFNTYRMN